MIDSVKSLLQYMPITILPLSTVKLLVYFIRNSDKGLIIAVECYFLKPNWNLIKGHSLQIYIHIIACTLASRGFFQKRLKVIWAYNFPWDICTFLYTGITLEILSWSGTIPLVKDKLYIKDKGDASAISLTILDPKLSGPGDLLFFKAWMILKTSRKVVGLQNMLPLFDLGRNFLNDCVSVFMSAW